MRERMVRAFDWFFRDRTTGNVVIAQLPNLPLGLFLAASIVRRAFSPEGTLGTAVGAVATCALLWWAGDELVRGVNPFRRALGAVVLLVTAAALFLR